jgi:hypothetical protein
MEGAVGHRAPGHATMASYAGLMTLPGRPLQSEFAELLATADVAFVLRDKAAGVAAIKRVLDAIDDDLPPARPRTASRM